MRQSVNGLTGAVVLFQSTHPVRGATRRQGQHEGTAAISIHAPREGCDLFDAAEDAGSSPFQSTHPVRGATRYRYTPDFSGVFQSTHPVRGATCYNTFRGGEKIFQSTHPVRGATVAFDSWCRYVLISIHAPREGCDQGYIRFTSK